MTTAIDVCMPTWRSEPVIRETLEHLAASVDAADVRLNRLVLVDNESDDRTLEIASGFAEEAGWPIETVSRACTLPEARRIAIDAVDTEWFLFLDDDVRIAEPYIDRQLRAMAPIVGAVQGRKTSKRSADRTSGGLALDRPRSATDWVRRRAFRGGTHATLLRHEAVESVDFPPDLVVWEDEYLRREVESNGYLWVFNHQAYFEHASLERHPAGWTEGYLQGKYNLRPLWHVALNLPYAVLTGQSPVAYTGLLLGYVRGRIARRFADAPLDAP